MNRGEEYKTAQELSQEYLDIALLFTNKVKNLASSKKEEALIIAEKCACLADLYSRVIFENERKEEEEQLGFEDYYRGFFYDDL